ncbi:MAG: winged helix-turn-helix transcriptional regulator [Acidimicrobiia bacterium]|nr:winged helix-turn-helix transcriptional regulator [Acidimicrobiia bacterium]
MPQIAASIPDYELDDVAVISATQGLKAIADDTRMAILDLLAERAATTSQLAGVLGKPKGTVGYHLDVLKSAGLVHVVRTAKVRALTEKYFGRVARTYQVEGPMDDRFGMLRRVMEECVFPEGEILPMFTLRHVRIPADRALEFAQRLVELSEEFVASEPGGDTTFGLLAGLYPTAMPGWDGDDE